MKALRFARSCYKHLAGVLAVEIHQSMVDRGYLAAEPDMIYRLTSAGEDWCEGLGISLSKLPGLSQRSRSITSRGCVDWTERRHHLGGALGNALFARLSDLKWIVPHAATRAVRVTHEGTRELGRQLGISIPH